MSGGEAGRLIVAGARAAGLGFALRIPARLLYLLIAARLFGPAPLGAFFVALSAIELAVTLSSLGTRKILFHLLDGGADGGAAEPRPRVHFLLDALFLAAAASAAAAAFLAGTALLIDSRALLLLAPAVVAVASIELLLAAARWTHRVRVDVVSRSIVEPLAGLAGTAAASLLGWRGVEGLALGYWCGMACAFVYASLATRAAFGGLRLAAYRPSRAAMAEILRLGPSNSGTDFLNVLYTRGDLYLVSALLGDAAAGLYGAARQIVIPLRQVRQSFDALLIPIAARTFRADGASASGPALASASRLILVLLLPMVLLVLTCGEEILALLGPQFVAAYPALLLFALAETVHATLGIGDLVFVYLQPRLGLRQALASTAFGLVAALLLIPLFGLAGGAAAVLAAYLLRGWLRSRALRRAYAIVTSAAHAAPVAIALAAAALGMAANQAEALVLPPLLALAAYAAGIAFWLRRGGGSIALTGFRAAP